MLLNLNLVISHVNSSLLFKTKCIKRSPTLGGWLLMESNPFLAYSIGSEVPIMYDSRWNDNHIIPVALFTEILSSIITKPCF